MEETRPISITQYEYQRRTETRILQTQLEALSQSGAFSEMKRLKERMRRLGYNSQLGLYITTRSGERVRSWLADSPLVDEAEIYPDDCEPTTLVDLQYNIAEGGQEFSCDLIRVKPTADSNLVFQQGAQVFTQGGVDLTLRRSKSLRREDWLPQLTALTLREFYNQFPSHT